MSFLVLGDAEHGANRVHRLVHRAADAPRDHGLRVTQAVQGMRSLRDQDGAGRTNRVPVGNGTAVGIEARRIDVQLGLHHEGHRKRQCPSGMRREKNSPASRL